MIRKVGLIKLKRPKVVLIAGLLVLLGINSGYAKLEDDIQARITPVGFPCLVGEECAVGVAVAGSSLDELKNPETIYQTYCFACHGTGANESPVLGNAEAWEPRIAKGIDVLYESALDGFNNNLMPARGLCMDCSDDDIKATVDYLVKAAQ